MSLTELRARYLSGEMEKAEYIEQMHELHARLFEYADYLRHTGIARIEIADGQVVMVSRESGVKIICHPEDRRVAPVETLNFGRYEPDEAAMFFRLIGPTPVVFDIGANVGWYSLNIARCFPGATVHAFEPVPSTYAQLCRNVAHNEVTNVRTYNIGFSDADREVAFFVDPHQSGSASAADLTEKADVDQIRCRLTTLDGFVVEHGLAMDAIKCDVEGAEFFVYKGGLDALRKHQPVIFTELLRKWAAKFDYHPNEVIGLLAGLGYRCFTAHDEHLVELSRIDESTEETNFFFLHGDRHAAHIGALVSASAG